MDHDDCPITRTLKVIGGKWKPIILHFLERAPRRTGELGRLIPQASGKMLTQQLRELERDGVIRRKVYRQVPPKVEYLLTPLGETLSPIMMRCACGRKGTRRAPRKPARSPSASWRCTNRKGRHSSDQTESLQDVVADREHEEDCPARDQQQHQSGDQKIARRRIHLLALNSVGDPRGERQDQKHDAHDCRRGSPSKDGPSSPNPLKPRASTPATARSLAALPKGEAARRPGRAAAWPPAAPKSPRETARAPGEEYGRKFRQVVGHRQRADGQGRGDAARQQDLGALHGLDANALSASSADFENIPRSGRG